jgi:hypothetical protein
VGNVEQSVAGFYSYRVGEKAIDGSSIAELYWLTPDVVVYRTDAYLDLRIESIVQTAWQLKVRGELEKYRGQAVVHFRGAYNKLVCDILAACVKSALQADDSNLDDHFKSLNAYFDKWAPLPYIYGKGAGFIVYKDKLGELSWEAPQDNKSSRLKAEVRVLEMMTTYIPNANKERLADLMGGAMASGFDSAHTLEEALKLFEPAREFARRAADTFARSIYLAASAWSGLILVALVWVIYGIAYLATGEAVTELRYQFLAVTGGILGALISIAQRSKSIFLTSLLPPSHHKTQGVVRVILGAIFGVLAVLVAKAQLALTLFALNPYSLFILSVMGGISERFVPDVLSRLAVTDDHKKADSKA